MAQTSYGFATPKGIAGGLYDISPYAIDSRLNEELTGVLKYGVGVVKGSNPGTNVALPNQTSQEEDFEGITLNGFTTQHDLAGNVNIINNQTVGVLRYGRCWACVAEGVTPKYGDGLFMIPDGPEAGYFTNVIGDISPCLPINGRFIGPVSDGIAPVELFNSQSRIVLLEEPVEEPIEVTLVSAVADGESEAVTSTKITVTFDKVIEGLTAADFSLTDDTGSAVKGALTAVGGGVYELALTSVTTEGNVTLSLVNPDGYVVTGSPKTVAVYKATE